MRCCQADERPHLRREATTAREQRVDGYWRGTHSYLVKGKTVTGFANVEEDFADNAVWNMNLLPLERHVMPWRIEDALRVRDGNLVTGQQNFSGTETARLVIETLGR